MVLKDEGDETRCPDRLQQLRRFNMKTSMTFKSITVIALLGAVLATPVLAQGGMGMGGGMGGGMGMQNGGTANWGPGMGYGGHGGRGMRFNQNNAARGWTLVTPEERTAFQIKMRAVKTYDECKVTQTDFRSIMETRAKDKGVSLMVPRQNACDNLKARGLIS
jgi:hypothetical protein